LSSKAKILVTNTISFCSQFDAISYLRRGVILETGTYADLVSDPESETARLVLGHGGGASTPGRSGSATPRSPSEVTRVSTPKSSHPSIDEKGFEELLREKLSRSNLSLDKSLLIASGEMPKQGTITTASRKEHSEQGRVKRTVYLEYARAASIWGFVLFFFLIVGNQVTAIAGTYSLRAWGNGLFTAPCTFSQHYARRSQPGYRIRTTNLQVPLDIWLALISLSTFLCRGFYSNFRNLHTQVCQGPS
jgi:ATP-binding cassette subfamily C (CFTR/MRP) protein 1